MTRIAIPSILQQSTVSIGMMLVQSVVNGFGSEALAGFSAAMRIESICVVPMSFRDFTQPVKWSLSVQQLSASF